MTDSIHAFLTSHHRECDELFVTLESEVGTGNWDGAGPSWRRFLAELESHFRAEEEVLFPAFEQHTGNANGPTEVMRCDHQQMRALLRSLDDDFVAREQDGFLGKCETMMVLIQQHNMREEQVLYPMADEVIADRSTLVQDLRDRLADQPEIQT